MTATFRHILLNLIAQFLLLCGCATGVSYVDREAFYERARSLRGHHTIEVMRGYGEPHIYELPNGNRVLSYTWRNGAQSGSAATTVSGVAFGGGISVGLWCRVEFEIDQTSDLVSETYFEGNDCGRN